MKVEGQVFIVTGATFGIGEALCERLASKGAKIVLAGRSKEQGEALVKKLGDRNGRKDDFYFVQTDVGDLAQVKRLFDQTISKFGDLYCIVNNAGISGVYVADVLKGTDEWKKTMDVNLMGPLQLSRLASTHWLRNKRKGLIINTGSISEFLFHQDPQYRASKAALSAQVATIKGSGDLKGTPYGRMELVRAVTVAVGFVYTTIWVNNSGGKWTTKEHVEKDPSFGPDLVRAGGWTDLNRVIDVYMRIIDDESLNGDTVIVSGNFPLQRKRMLLSDDEWRGMMTNKATALL